MNFNEIRKLRADEIECRVAQVSAKGCSLLLYKTARCDRTILDETFGAMSWQNDFKVIDGKMYGGIGIYSNDLGEWIWKWDCGTESNTEQEKGQASDCFKRAGFKWGIGVELYNAPFIWLNVPTKKNDKGKYELENKFAKYEVTHICYRDEDITELEITDDKGNVVYTFGTGKKVTKKETVKSTEDVIREVFPDSKPTKEEPKKEGLSVADLKCALEEAPTLKDLLSVFNANSKDINGDKELKELFKNRRTELMK